jgi:hypothetical protein
MKVLDYIKNNIWAATLTVFCLFFSIYGAIYFFVDGISAPDDHFFHIKLAHLLKTDGFDIINNFNYLPIDKYSRYPLSLFNVFLIPFTFFSDLSIGLKVADVFGSALAIAVIYFALRKFKFKHPFLILLVLFSSAYISSRLFFGRAYTLTLGLILLELYFAQNKKYIKLFLMTLLHVLWHQNSFFLPMMVVFVVEPSRYLVEKKMDYKNFMAVSISIFAGMAFFPDFPQNILRWFSGIVSLSSNVSTGLKLEGAELYTKNILEVLKNNQLFFLLTIVSVVLVIYFYVKNKKEEYVFRGEQGDELMKIFSSFLMLIVFLLGSIAISGRFFDYYFILVVVLFVGILRLASSQREILVNEKFSKYIIAAFFIVFSYFSINNFLDLSLAVANSDYKTIKAPVEWIRDNSEEKEMVYLQNWSDFPEAFFYNDKNIYSWGLEPRDLSFKSSELYWKAYNIMAYRYYCEKLQDCEEDAGAISETLKKSSEEDREKIRKENSRKIINSIKNDFGVRFILSSNVRFSEILNLNEDLIADKFESVSEKDASHKITAFKLK